MPDVANATCGRADVIEVMNRYGAAIDEGDWERLRSCFVTGARLVFPTRALEGTDAIVAYISQVAAGKAWQQHLLGSHQVAVAADRATATCSLFATQVPIDPREPVVTTIGTYYDDLRWTDDGWKIVRRELRVGHVKQEARTQ